VGTTDERSFNEQSIAEFRESHGRVAAFGDAPLLLLTTIGSKSGLPRTVPLMYLTEDGETNRVYVFASASGADSHPAWFNNLVAHPDDLVVEIADESTTADGEVVPEPLRAELYAKQAERYPVFAGYENATSRTIPVVALNLHGS
jgi:deazaflavin-dependent oxidoreductase (nitroreductase family)